MTGWLECAGFNVTLSAIDRRACRRTRRAAIAAARDLRQANPTAMYEIRPVTLYRPGVPFPLTEAGVDEQA